MMIPEFPCYDCSVNTCPLEGNREYYEVNDELWTSAGASGKGQSDNGTGGFFLCISCLEKRLGRKLKPLDFKPVPANIPSPWLSEKLNSRLGRGFLASNHKRLADVQQFFPDALYNSIVKRFHPYWTYRNHAGATAIGINRERPEIEA